MIPLESVVNSEQLLDFALSYLATQNSDDEAHPVAADIVIHYILNEFETDGREEFTEEEIEERYSELLTEHVLTNLVSKGLVDVDFSDDEPKYKLKEEFKWISD